MVIPEQKGVMIKCRKCGAQALASTFKLDPEYKTVVCQNCYQRKPHSSTIQNSPFGAQGFSPINKVASDKDVIDKVRNSNPSIRNVPSSSKIVSNPKGAGWDRQDDFLELSMLKKREDEEKFQPSMQKEGTKVVGPNKIKVKCFYCEYSYPFDTERNFPKNCPYCGKANNTN
ncbi:MAG: hypothetical protein WC755_05470 [Candidatus Woesearchaeota archaeon]|jgi:hypothetical protein